MSIGEQAYQNARKRLEQLEKEADRLREFIAMCERYAEVSPQQEITEVTTAKVDNSIPAIPRGERVETGPGRPTATPDVIREIAREETRKRGKPMARGALVTAIENRGYAIRGKDKSTQVGTVMWRAKGDFVNFSGVGYWPADLPYTPEGYEGAAHTKETEANENSHSSTGPSGDSGQSTNASMSDLIQ